MKLKAKAKNQGKSPKSGPRLGQEARGAPKKKQPKRILTLDEIELI